MNDAQHYKNTLGNRAKDIILQGTGMREVNGKVLCPLHPDKNPSMSWDNNAHQFHCFACNGNIDIYSYFQNYRSMTFPEAVDNVRELIGEARVEPVIPVKKQYKKATKEYQELNDSVIKDAAARGINKETLIDWKVQTSKGSWYSFRYFDEKGNVVCNTFRKVGEKKCMREPGTKSILWGLDHIDTKKPIIITEGQFDAMAVWQSGYKNVVSIPSGINDKNWIMNSFDFLSTCDNFIIWADNDEQGINGAKEIKKRLGSDKTSIAINDKYKDANDLLKATGENGVKSFIDEILIEKVNGVVDMGRRTDKEEYNETFYTGIYEIDRHFKKLKGGDLTLIFGRDNEGKSTFISQVISNMLKNYKVFLYSGELSESRVENWIMRQLIGRRRNMIEVVRNEWGDKEFLIKNNVKLAIKSWYKDKFFMYDDEANEDIFVAMKNSYMKHGVKVFVIDNIMTAINGDSESNSEQTEFIKECKKFAKRYNVIVIVIGHPNKIGSLEHQEQTKAFVNGSKNITNLMDNIIAVERVWDFESELTGIGYMEMDKDNQRYSTIIRALKDRVAAGRAYFNYHFDIQSNRFFNDNNSPQTYFGWEKALGINEVEEAFQETAEKCPWD